MVIKNLQYLSVLHVVNRLGDLIVIDQNQRPLARIQQVPSGNGANVRSSFVKNRKVTVPLLRHDLLDLVGKVAQMKRNQIVRLHKEIDWHRLVDQPGYRIRV